MGASIYYLFAPIENVSYLRFLSGIEHFLMFFNGVSVCHTGDVIAEGSLQSAFFDEELHMVGQGCRFGLIGVKQIRYDALSLDLHADVALVPE